MFPRAMKKVRAYPVEVTVAVAGLLGIAMGWLTGSWLIALTALVIATASYGLRWSYWKVRRSMTSPSNSASTRSNGTASLR